MYKVGDTVQIKSLEWYEKEKNENDFVDIPYKFIPPMSKFCGKKAKIIKRDFNDTTQTYQISVDEETNSFIWTDKMFDNLKIERKIKLKKLKNND